MIVFIMLKYLLLYLFSYLLTCDANEFVFVKYEYRKELRCRGVEFGK